MILRPTNTTQLERELLKILLTDKLSLLKVAPKLKVEWMTGDKRPYLLETIKKTFSDFRSTITRKSLEYEIDKHFENQNPIIVSDFKMELEIIYKENPVEKIGFIIERLDDALRSYNIQKIVDQSADLIYKGDIANAEAALKVGVLNLASRAEEKKVSGLHTSAEGWFEEILKRKEHPEEFCGIKTGFKRFDDMTGGLFGAELTLFFGLAGKGKSTVMKNISSRIRQQGYNILHVTNEENEFQVRTKYMSLETGIEYKKFKRGFISDEEIELWKEYNTIQKNGCYGDVYIQEIRQSMDSTTIYSAWMELKQLGIKIDAIVVDYMDLMGSVNKSYSEWDEQTKVVNDLKQLAIDTDLPVITCTQAAIGAEKYETKDNPFLTSADIYGSKAKSHTANTIIGIINKSATVNVTSKSVLEQNRQKLIFCVCKNRDGEIFAFRQVMEGSVGRLIEDDEDDNIADEIAKKSLLSLVDGATDPVETVKKNEKEIQSIRDKIQERLEKAKSKNESIIDKVRKNVKIG